VTRRASSLRARWEGFWFAPTDPATLALVRIAVGVVALLWTVSLGPDLGALFSRAGLVGSTATGQEWWNWSVLYWAGSDLALGAVYVALLCASVGMLAGWHARWSAAVVFVALTSLARADAYVFNSGDTLLRLLVFYLAVAPSGAGFSLDALRARRDGGPLTRTHAAWPLRLIQIQVTVLYLAALWSKLHGATWRDGTAVAYAVRLPDLVRFPVPDVFSGSAAAAHVATYGTMLVEGALAVCLWHRRTRTAALLAGVAFHLSIDLSIRVGFFTLAVFCAYLSFLDPARVRDMADAFVVATRRRSRASLRA
jgi:hypothetical protein